MEASSYLPHGVLVAVVGAGLLYLYKRNRATRTPTRPRKVAVTEMERAQAIAQFQSLAACEFEEAREALEASEWDLNEALLTAGLITQDRIANNEPRHRRSLLVAAWSILMTIWRLGLGMFTSLIPGLTGRVPGVPTGRAMRNHFEQHYGNVHPTMQEESLSRALAASKRDKLFLLAYLHSPVHPSSKTFCRDTLASEAVSEYIDANFLFWAADVTTSREGYAIANSFRATEYPFVAVLWQVGEEVRALATFAGGMDIDTFISRLIQVNDTNANLLVAAHDIEVERQNSRVLLQQQDDEYEASLRRDREREMAEIAVSVVDEPQHEVIEILDEPDPSEPDALKLVFRLPHGRFNRYFRDSQRLCEVYAVIDAKMAEEDPEFVGVFYRLVTAYPRSIYERCEESLSSAGITNNTLLLYEELA